jgi:hypothetical protein
MTRNGSRGIVFRKPNDLLNLWKSNLIGARLAFFKKQESDQADDARAVVQRDAFGTLKEVPFNRGP